MNEFDVDRSAPVLAEVTTDVAAPIEAVWAALTDVTKWPEFTPKITAARLDGALAVGSIIYFTVGAMEIISSLVIVEPLRRLVWRGGETAVHSWAITPTETGCQLVNAESIGKPFPGKTAEASSELVADFLAQWNEALSQRALTLV